MYERPVDWTIDVRLNFHHRMSGSLRFFRKIIPLQIFISGLWVVGYMSANKIASANLICFSKTFLRKYLNLKFG